MNMKTADTDKIVKLLEVHYQDAASQSRAWDFFVRLAEYMKLILESNILDKYIHKLEEERDAAHKAFNDIDAKAIQELEVAYKKIGAQVEDAGIDINSVNRALKEIRMLNEGNI